MFEVQTNSTGDAKHSRGSLLTLRTAVFHTGKMRRDAERMQGLALVWLLSWISCSVCKWEIYSDVQYRHRLNVIGYILEHVSRSFSTWEAQTYEMSVSWERNLHLLVGAGIFRWIANQPSPVLQKGEVRGMFQHWKIICWINMKNDVHWWLHITKLCLFSIIDLCSVFSIYVL